MSTSLGARIEEAVSQRQLMESSAKNILKLLESAKSDLAARVVTELVDGKQWAELNDRFYQTLAFGTGGLRGRTIGRVLTKAEEGTPNSLGRPEFPCVGTNSMNFYNIRRATHGLATYLREWSAREQLEGKPKIVVAHDTRYFSKEFTALAAEVAAENGCDAFVFDGPRSTPELSFAVRYLEASAGIVITASHNPPHDNGYKVYFRDGAQVVEPHASGIIEKVNADDTTAVLDSPKGAVITLGDEIDDAYMTRLATLILDPEMVKAQRALRIVFTPIHGTGGVIIKPMLKKLGFKFTVVSAQDEFDGRFPTVKSPNPENAEALKLGMEQAEKEGADLVVATDPDCDRMGVAVRSRDGTMKLLTGNQIGALMAYYRAKTLFERGVLTKENASRGVIIKTFVTTDLQKAIAAHYGLRCVETLTGFKYIGAKLGKYEEEVSGFRVQGSENLTPSSDDSPLNPEPRTLKPAPSSYHQLTEDETRALRLQHSSYYIFGGEESYGYSGADFVRDKDGNGATIMFCEVAAYAKSRGLTLDALLDDVYATFGYYQEKNGAMTFEGAEGAAKIKRLLESYVASPPKEMLGSPVAAVKNFEQETFRDVEGDMIPKEKMLIFELQDRTRIAVRGSGTEPKIKYYLFAQRSPSEARWTEKQLTALKEEVTQHLERLWSWLQEDAQMRERDSTTPKSAA